VETILSFVGGLEIVAVFVGIGSIGVVGCYKVNIHNGTPKVVKTKISKAIVGLETLNGTRLGRLIKVSAFAQIKKDTTLEICAKIRIVFQELTVWFRSRRTIASHHDGGRLGSTLGTVHSHATRQDGNIRIIGLRIALLVGRLLGIFLDSVIRAKE
jgi:hypothetical protein